MRREGGGRTDPIGLRGALADRLLVALIAAMALFATCALAGHEAVNQLAKRWQQGANAAVAVQIPNPTPARMEAALEVLRALPAVREAQAVDPARMAELLRPWLGDVAGLPLPGVIELRLADLAADPVLIGDRLAAALRHPRARGAAIPPCGRYPPPAPHALRAGRAARPAPLPYGRVLG
ncbi:MAG: hypothetical protein ACKOC9_06895, partial [Alphaproteobacteria bacterium]